MAMRIFRWLLALAIGIVCGLIGTVVHQSSFESGGIVIPWGMVFALISIACLLTGMRLISEDRGLALMSALGVLASIAVLSFKSPGGSVLIPNNFLGTAWIFAPVIIAAVVIAWPRVKRHGPSTAARPSDGERGGV